MAPENDLPDNEDVKKKALVRLTVAGLVTAAALGGLWWLDQGNKSSPGKRAQAPQPAPIRPAQIPEPALPQAEPAAEAPSGPEAEARIEEAAPPMAAPPPPRVSNAPRAMPPQPEPIQPRHPTPPLASPPSPAKIPPSIPPMAAAGEFVVQLGVFSNPTLAQDLVQRLRKQGIRASTETRVHVGPFLNRQEAEKAQTELKRLGLNALVTTATPTK